MTKRRLQRPVETRAARREWREVESREAGRGRTEGEVQKGEMKKQGAVSHRASEFPVWEVETILTCLGSINTAANSHHLGPVLTHKLF